MAIWRMRIACWIPKAIDTHSKYVILRFVDNSGYSNALQCVMYTYIAYLVALKVVVRAAWFLFCRTSEFCCLTAQMVTVPVRTANWPKLSTT